MTWLTPSSPTRKTDGQASSHEPQPMHLLLSTHGLNTLVPADGDRVVRVPTASLDSVNVSTLRTWNAQSREDRAAIGLVPTSLYRDVSRIPSA